MPLFSQSLELASVRYGDYQIIILNDMLYCEDLSQGTAQDRILTTFWFLDQRSAFALGADALIPHCYDNVTYA
ncbi:MAG: hypothetical protein SXV54_22665 [Chloroflexota bacterium]|nr:hypothetical protein [Chloroflexota bacterium]